MIYILPFTTRVWKSSQKDIDAIMCNVISMEIRTYTSQWQALKTWDVKSIEDPWDCN
jgi:hypothetical protein